jgi:hypothetical protein
MRRMRTTQIGVLHQRPQHIPSSRIHKRNVQPELLLERSQFSLDQRRDHLFLMPSGNVVPGSITLGIISMEPNVSWFWASSCMFSQATSWHACMAIGQLRTLSISIVRSSASGSPHLENQRMASIRAGKSLGSNVCFEVNPAVACPLGTATGVFNILTSSSDSSVVSWPRRPLSSNWENRSGINWAPGADR